MKKPYLSGAVHTCEPTLGWWYFVSESGRQDHHLEGIYGPFHTRDAAREDRARRCEMIKHVRYRSPFGNPLRAKAFVVVENGQSVWRRHKTDFYGSDHV